MDGFCDQRGCSVVVLFRYKIAFGRLGCGIVDPSRGDTAISKLIASSRSTRARNERNEEAEGAR